RERLIQAEGIADGEGTLPHLQVVRRADLDRLQLALGRPDHQYAQVLVRSGANDVRRPVRVIGQDDWGAGRVADYVVVGDESPLVAQDEPRAGGRRRLILVKTGDVNDRRRHLAEQVDGGSFLGSKLAALGNGARLGLWIVAARRPRPEP